MDKNGLSFAREVIGRVFFELNDRPLPESLAERDAFSPFLVNMDSEPRVVASAWAMSRLSFVPEDVSQKFLKLYEDTYSQGFYGAAIEFYDFGEDSERRLELKDRFTEYGAAAGVENRRKLSKLDYGLFAQFDGEVKDAMNGGTLGGCFARHCITARVEDGVFTLAYNPMSEDDSGSLAATERKDDVVLVTRRYTSEEIEKIVKDKNRECAEINSVLEEAKNSFSAAFEDVNLNM